MSYPWANDLLYTLTRSEPPPRAQTSSPQPKQGRGAGAEPRERLALASFDAFLARAEQQAHGWIMMMMRLPPRDDGPVTVLIQEPQAPHIFARSQLALNSATAEIAEFRTGQDEIHPVVQTREQITQSSMEVAKIAMEQTNSNAINGRAQNQPQGALRNWNAELYPEDSLLMVYGSVTGTAEMLAHNLAEALRRAGYAVRVRDMAHCEPNVLTQANYVLMVVSTYGDGEPPDDAVPFWQFVVHGNGLDLRGVRFSVLALGNTTFEHFCRVWPGNSMRHWHATAQFESIRASIATSITKAPAKRWLDGVLAFLQKDKQSLST